MMPGNLAQWSGEGHWVACVSNCQKDDDMKGRRGKKEDEKDEMRLLIKHYIVVTALAIMYCCSPWSGGERE